MDVRGPADSHDAKSNLSQVREGLRIEAAEGAPNEKSPSTMGPSTSEVVRLVQQLRALPEVRAELVALAVAKLQGGQFSTRESAERTAEAVLRTLSKE